MKRPAVFFDRDNTLIVSDGYLGDPSKVVLVEGAADAVARARALGFAVVVFSNQSGVARGMFTEDDVHRVNARLDELLADQNPQAVIDRHEFSPFHPEGTIAAYAKESDMSKPKPGMIFQAAEKLALDLLRSWVVGDAPRDIEAGKAAGCRTIWYKDSRLPPSMAARELMLTVPDAVVSTLKEATDVIAREALLRHASPPEPPPIAAPPQSPVRLTDTQPAARTDDDGAKPRLREPASVSDSTSDEGMPDEPDAGQKVEPPGARRSAGPKSVSSAKPLMQVLAQKRATAVAAEPPLSQPPTPAVMSTARLEELAEQILQELQHRHDAHDAEFSVSKLLAGIMQIIAIAVLFLAYFLYRTSPALLDVLVIAVFLQVFTIALLIMGRQR